MEFVFIIISLALLGGAVGANILHVPTDVSWAECGQNHLNTVPNCRLSPQLLSFTITAGCVGNLAFKPSRIVDTLCHNSQSQLSESNLHLAIKDIHSFMTNAMLNSKASSERLWPLRSFQCPWKKSFSVFSSVTATATGTGISYFCGKRGNQRHVSKTWIPAMLRSAILGAAGKVSAKTKLSLSVNASAGVRPDWGRPLLDRRASSWCNRAVVKLATFEKLPR